MKYLIYIINIILVFLILRYEHLSTSDKTITITSILYIALLVINLVIAFALRLGKNPLYKHFNRSVLVVIIITIIYLAGVSAIRFS